MKSKNKQKIRFSYLYLGVPTAAPVVGLFTPAFLLGYRHNKKSSVSIPHPAGLIGL
jgi:hypothetical protein